jgi:hypothetical protein
MARQIINIGTVANDGTGDVFRIAGEKINDNFSELYSSFDVYSLGDGIDFKQNDIKALRSNDDINLTAAGTGAVAMNNLLVDASVSLTDNKISTVNTNQNLELQANGTGSIRLQSLNFFDNTVTTTESNSNLEFKSNSSGKVTINGLSLPKSDNAGLVQVLKTDGAGTLSFVTADYSFDHTVMQDGTVTLASSTEASIDTFDSTVYRSTRYLLSITDTTNSRYEIVEAVVTHDGSTAYVNDAGSTTNHTSSLLTLTADISGGDVRLRAVPISNDSTVIKYFAKRQVI